MLSFAATHFYHENCNSYYFNFKCSIILIALLYVYLFYANVVVC